MRIAAKLMPHFSSYPQIEGKDLATITANMFFTVKSFGEELRLAHYEKSPDETLSETELNETIRELCDSKAEEFRLLGYEQVTGEDVWYCVSDKYKTGYPPLHRIVNDILSLKATTLMNWITLSIYKDPRR